MATRLAYPSHEEAEIVRKGKLGVGEHEYRAFSTACWANRGMPKNRSGKPNLVVR